MPQSYHSRFAKGAENLLINCAKCQAGQAILIVCETDTVGYYDPAMGHAIQSVGHALGLETEIIGVPLNREVCDPDPHLVEKMKQADCTLFLARLGDQIRFRPKDAQTTQVISYALDGEMLASPFGTVEYSAMEGLRDLINDAIYTAEHVHITCPAGTDFSGQFLGPVIHGSDTTLKRFPVSVYAPIPAEGFRGKIAQNGFLTGTGSQYYTPWTCGLNETLFVHFENNRITRFEGREDDIAAAKAHYEFVSEKYGLDTYYVHSWHGGIHPGCNFAEPANAHFERWSGGAFGNPRLMHFHTCGAYPPGEISLNILDATVRVDDMMLWQNGCLFPERLAGGAALFRRHPDLKAVFDAPALSVGQAPCGQLRYA